MLSLIEIKSILSLIDLSPKQLWLNLNGINMAHLIILCERENYI